jgi:hypothetical protein
VPLITYGSILYDKKRGPSTIPPAIPQIPVRIAEIIQNIDSFAIGQNELNFKSF